VQLDNSIVMEDADPDAIRLDDLESNASLDEDAVPMRKVTANNRVRDS
jgi:rRNA-processing protein EBP2